MRMCCDWMSNGIGRMNDSGPTIAPRRQFGGDFFALRFRAIAPDVVAELSKDLPRGTPLTTGGELAINHCPGCGAKLSDWITEHAEDFEVLLGQVID